MAEPYNKNYYANENQQSILVNIIYCSMASRSDTNLNQDRIPVYPKQFSLQDTLTNGQLATKTTK